MMEMFSNYAVWLFMIGIIAYGMMKKVDCVHACIQGAEKGFAAYLRTLPTMLCMLSAIAVARQSGLLGAITKLLVPAAEWIHLPAEVLPLVILRPFSGGGAMALLAELLTAYGADSAIGRAACIIMGSSETLFYCATLYFGSVGVTKWRYTIPVSLCCSLVGVLTAALFA